MFKQVDYRFNADGIETDGFEAACVMRDVTGLDVRLEQVGLAWIFAKSLGFFWALRLANGTSEQVHKKQRLIQLNCLNFRNFIGFSRGF